MFASFPTGTYWANIVDGKNILQCILFSGNYLYTVCAKSPGRFTAISYLYRPWVSQRPAIFFFSFVCLLGPCTRSFMDFGQKLLIWEQIQGIASKYKSSCTLLSRVTLATGYGLQYHIWSQINSFWPTVAKFGGQHSKRYTDTEKKNCRVLWFSGTMQ